LAGTARVGLGDVVGCFGRPAYGRSRDRGLGASGSEQLIELASCVACDGKLSATSSRLGRFSCFSCASISLICLLHAHRAADLMQCRSELFEFIDGSASELACFSKVPIASRHTRKDPVSLRGHGRVSFRL
jgi:hypothetical protein